MSSRTYFHWFDHVRVVYGTHRSAVYNFQNGAVYSLNHSATQITRLIDANSPFNQMNRRQKAFVGQLRELQLGKLAYSPLEFGQEDVLDKKRHPLIFLWLELTGGCNLGCVHCYAESQNPILFPTSIETSTSGPSMRIENWCKVLRKGAELGCERVQFIGGEALLYPHLLELIDTAQKNGYTFIEVYTNGTLLTERKVKMLAERNVHLAVSLHGSEANIHDTVTGLPGSFERTIAGLRRLQEYGVPFRISGTAVKSNQHNIIHIKDIANDLGANESSFDVVREVGSGSNPDLLPDDSEVLAQKWLTWPDFVANRADFEHNHRWNPCWAGKLAVTSTGDVMPCVMGRSQVVGNVHEESLEEILNKPRLLTLWGLTKDQVAVCQDCEYRYVCGDCRPLAASGGDLHGAIPRCTYNPQDGTWGRPGTEARRPGPAPEDSEPRIALSSKRSETDLLQDFKNSPGENDEFRCDPHSSESDDKSWTQTTHFPREPDTGNNESGRPAIVKFPSKSPNHHFRCDPDR